MDRLEQADLSFRYCRLCECILSETDHPEDDKPQTNAATDVEKDDKINTSPMHAQILNVNDETYKFI